MHAETLTVRIPAEMKAWLDDLVAIREATWPGYCRSDAVRELIVLGVARTEVYRPPTEQDLAEAEIASFGEDDAG